MPGAMSRLLQTFVVALTLCCAIFFGPSPASASAIPILEQRSLEDFASPGPYHMGTMMIDAPKASAFRPSYGYAPIVVYYPVDAPGGQTLAMGAAGANGTRGATPPTFHAIGFAHGAGAQAEYYTGLYAHMVSHGFVVTSVRNMAPVPATLGDDMCHGLAWILAESEGRGLYGEESMFFGRVATEGVGTMGHSMGGGGSIHCAMNWPQKVRAVAPIHPAPGGPPHLIYAPMMVPTGSLDFVTSPMMVKAAVFDGSPSPKIMPIMNGVGHREPVNYAGANRWHPYLAAFFSLYLKRDFSAAMLVWGEEVGSLARDSRISVAHRNKGSVVWLETAKADVSSGKVTSVTGKVTKTTPLTRGAHYHLRAFKRIENGFDVDVGFEIKATNEYEIDFVVHMSPDLAPGAGAGREQKVTIAAVNTNDGGSVSFHDIFLTLDSAGGASGGRAVVDPSRTGSFYDNQKEFAPPGAEEVPQAPQTEVTDHDYQWYLGTPPTASEDTGTSDNPWLTLQEQRSDISRESWPQPTQPSANANAPQRSPTSGTRFTVVEDEVRASIVSGGEDSWADVLYSSSKNLQKRPERPSFESLRQQQQRREEGGDFGGPFERVGGWESQLFPVSSSSVPTSLLPWGSVLNPSSDPNSGGVVLGLMDFPGGYGDAREGKPLPVERELMTWINTVRSAPLTFEGAYAARGCTADGFGRSERSPQRPLHLSHVLAESAQGHSTNMAAEDFVSHLGSDDSSPFDRMDGVGYQEGYRGENICAGMKNPFDCVASFMCSEAHRENLMSDTFREMGIGLSTNLATQYKHYWTLNLGHAGSVNQGAFMSSFDSDGRNLRTLSVGSHQPEEPIDEVTFSSSFYDYARSAPEAIAVVANGVEFPLGLKYGSASNGLYQQRVQLLSIPMWQVLSGSAPCIIYHFKALGGDGNLHRFPELGSYGFGGCDFDDPLAKWVSFRNETAVRIGRGAGRDHAWPVGVREGLQGGSRGEVARFSSVEEEGFTPFASDLGICLTDTHVCADGSVAKRVPPACQFHCTSGDPMHLATDLDFLKSNEQRTFGGARACATTGAQFWSGIWNWCPEVLDEAWRDPENPYRWLIPLWREVQKIDWVAAANAMTEFWQNMQQCKTYTPQSIGPETNLLESLSQSAIRVDQKRAVRNMQRVIVRTDLRYEHYTSLQLYLTHRSMLGNTVVEKSILLGDSKSGAGGEVIYDDFAGAPMPGWWGSWLETFGKTVWRDVGGGRGEEEAAMAAGMEAVPETQRFTVMDGRSVPLRAPLEALTHFTDRSQTSSAGIWELSLDHDDPVQSAAIGSWDLMVCGEPLSTALNFSSDSSGSCGSGRGGSKARHPQCPDGNSQCAHERAMHTCGSVSTVGGSSTQPPAPGREGSGMGSILQINDVMHVQPLQESSMFCSQKPVTQEGWAQPLYQSGLDLGLYLFHHEDPSRERGAWKLVDQDSTTFSSAADGAGSGEAKRFAHVRSGGARSGCWIFYVVSQRGAGPYDFWVSSKD